MSRGPSSFAQRRRGRSARAGTGGFTLTELLVAVTLLGALVAIAVPSFSNAALGSRLTNTANTFLASAQLARSEAIKRNASVTLCPSANGTACATSGGWQQGWIVFTDTNANGEVDGDDERVSYQQAIGAEYSFTGGVMSVVFQPSGLNATGGTLTLCRRYPAAGTQERVVRMSTTGRVSIEKTFTATCTGA